MRPTLKATIAALALAAPAAVLAQQAPVVGHQMQTEQARINNGVASGQRTRHEAAVDEHHLRADERLRAEQRARDGGRPLSAAQRARDEQLLKNNSARIYDTKHNNMVAPPR